MLMVQAFNDAEEIALIKDLFLSLDDDFSGTLEKGEILKLFKMGGQEITVKEVENIIDSIYFKEKGLLTFTEFEAAVLDREFYVDKKRLRTLYNYLDTDESGSIEAEDIHKCYRRFGLNLDSKKIHRMIVESDFDYDGKISFDEFVRIMNSEVADKTLNNAPHGKMPNFFMKLERS